MSEKQQIYIAAYIVVAICHLVGLLLLSRARNDIPNQRLLTKNLAVTELLFCLYAVVGFSVIVGKKDGGVPIRLFLDAFFYCLFSVELRFSILHIIMDRFAEVFLNIKYPIYMTLNRNLALVVINWSASVLMAITITGLAGLRNPDLYHVISEPGP